MKNYKLQVKDFICSDLDVHVFGSGKPEVLVTGGIHGGEATGIYAAGRLLERLSEQELLKGSVKIIRVCNPTAFRRMERTSPYDNLDMNRIFPGSPDGSLTQRVSNALWEESQSADYIVDLHCCGVHGYSYTLGVFEEYPQAKALSDMLDIPLAVQSGGTAGQLFVETCASGRSAVIIELPGGGEYGAVNQEAGDSAYRALTGMLTGMGMLDGEATSPRPRYCGKLMPQRAALEGLFLPAVKAGESVSEGQVLGTLNGETVISPADGTLTSWRPASYVFTGTYLGSLAPHNK